MDELIHVSAIEMEQFIHTREAIEEDVIIRISSEMKPICAMAKEKSEQPNESFFGYTFMSQNKQSRKHLIGHCYKNDKLDWPFDLVIVA